MGGRLLRAGLGLFGSAVVAAGLGACAQVLGLDETLAAADAEVSDDGGVLPDAEAGSRDATTPPADGGDAGDGGGRATDSGGDGAASTYSAWHLDPTFQGTGVLSLTMEAEGTWLSPGTLELLVSNGDVCLVGVGTTSAGDSRVIAFDVSTTAELNMASPSGTFSLLGVSPVGPLPLSFAAFVGNSAGDLYAASASTVYAVFGNTYLVPRVVPVGDGEVVGPGRSDGGARVDRLTITPSGLTTNQGLAGTSAGETLLVASATAGAGWFGGFTDGGGVPRAILLSPDGVEAPAGGTSVGPSAVTDFAATDGGLFAVGYVGGSFAAWPTEGDASAGPTVTPVPSGVAFTGTSVFRAAYPYSFVRACVAADDSIVASGAFGRPYLAAWDMRTMRHDLLAEPDGGTGPLLDTTPYLPALPSADAWYTGAVLCAGDFIYAAFAADALNGPWVVVRLTRVATP